jgi:two-component system response regulator DesR
VIRIVLGQNGALLRGALSELLSREPDLDVVAELARTHELPDAVTRRRPDVAVVDATLPGDLAVGELCNALPGCAVLVLLDPHSGAGLGRSLVPLAPRVGLIATEASPDEFLQGLRQLARGEPVLDPLLAVAALTVDVNPLTGREVEVLRLVVDGAPAKEIATRLALNVGTVRNHLSRILAKTGARTRVEAVRIAQDAGWI